MIPKRQRVVLLLLLGALTLTAVGMGGAFFHPVIQTVFHDGANDGPRTAAPGVVCYGYVDTESGCASLSALQSGRVASILVRERDRVAAGAPLVRLEEQPARARVAEARANVAAARAQLHKARTLPERHKLSLAAQRSAIEALDSRLAAARTAFVRKQELLQGRLIDSKEAAIALDQVKEIEALRASEVTRLAELQLHDPEVEVCRAAAELDAVAARLADAEQTLADCTLKAPQAGTVVRVLVAPGDVLGGATRQAAVMFAPEEPRIIRAEVEQEFAPRVAPGQRVLVQDDVDPNWTLHGTVKHLSDWYLPRRTIFQEPNRFSDSRTLECIVTLERGHPPLRIGQRVRVMITTGSP